jgi:curli biogenesis system outer membrane secretion channel CsgG
MFRLVTILLFAVLAFHPQMYAYSSIKFQEMTTTGTGQSLEEAVNNALSDAITMVNGKNVYTKTVIKVLGGESVEQSSKAKELQSFLSSKFSEIKETIANSTNSGDSSSVDVNVNIQEPAKKAYSQQYVKDIINEVKGGIKSYDILSKEVDSNGWHHVQIRSQVARFEIPQSAQRTRIAIVPFRFYEERSKSSSILDSLKNFVSDDNIKTLKSSDEKYKLGSSDKERLLRLINQGLTNYLTQTRKFTILDREYIKEIADEKLNIIEGRAPAIEMAKLGNEVSSDFIFVGSVEDFTVKDKVIKIQSSDKEISRKVGSFYVTYRLLDVATKQIQNANNYKVTATFKSDDPIEIITTLVDKAVKIIGQEVLFTAHPVIVENYNDDTLILGQGGNQFKKGDSYELYEKGEKIIDSYTNEAIGNVEKYLGKVEITQVRSNLSQAKFTEGAFDMSVGFIPGQYIVRPVQYDEEALKKEQFKINKKKILKARQERQKALEEKKEQRRIAKEKRMEEREQLKNKRDAEVDDLF